MQNVETLVTDLTHWLSEAFAVVKKDGQPSLLSKKDLV